MPLLGLHTSNQVPEDLPLLSLTEGTGGINDSLNDCLTADVDLFDQTRTAKGFCELERLTGCSLLPVATGLECNAVGAWCRADNAVYGLNVLAGNCVLKASAIRLRDNRLFNRSLSLCPGGDHTSGEIRDDRYG